MSTSCGAPSSQVLADERLQPSACEVAAAIGWSPKEVREGLGELADRYALALSADGDAIAAAHPFWAAPRAPHDLERLRAVGFTGEFGAMP
jgi:hypothetical protein